MTPVVVAWVLQLAWEITRCALGVDGLKGQPYWLSYAVTLATTIVLAVGFGGIARRTVGRRRAGAIVACAAHVVMVGAFVTRELLLEAQSEHAWGFVRALRNGGWTVVEVAAIIGLALVAGRRARWLAPPAIGLVFFALPPSTIYVTQLPWLALVWRTLAVAIFIVLADDARCAISPREPKPVAAVRAAVLSERLCWFFVVLNIASFVTPNRHAFGPALAVAISNVVGDTIIIIATWRLASAQMPRLPRWPLYASAACALWALLRTGRSWLSMIFLDWGHLGSVPLHTAHWAYSVPAFLASVLGMLSYAVYAGHTHRRAILVVAAAGAAFTVAHIALRIVGVDILISEPTLLATNVAAAFVFRMLRTAFQAEVQPEMPPARLL